MITGIPGIDGILDGAIRATRGSLGDSPEALAAAANVINVASKETSAWVRHDAGPLQSLIRVGFGATEGVNALKTYGAENVPKTGGFILAGNHGSRLDDLYYMAGHDRTVRLIANHQSLEMPIVGRVLKESGRFPVEYGRSDAALADARGIVAKGEGVMWFPEGERVLEDVVGEFHSGFARVALETGVPIVPAATRGNKPRPEMSLLKKLFSPQPIQTMYGAPLHYPGVPATRENVKMVVQDTQAAVTALYNKLREISPQ